MSNKNKNKNKQTNRYNFPYSNEVKLMKDEFKNLIDRMSDEEFLDLIFYLSLDFDESEEAWAEDEGWEDEAEKFYNKGKNNINNFPTENDDLLF